MTIFSVATLSRLLLKREVSACEVLDFSIQSINKKNTSVNAFTDTCYDRARSEAMSIDARRAKGEILSPIAGVPYAVKNLFDIQGLTTRAGSKINRDHKPATEDAVLVQRLQRAGAVLLGALNMDEYAYGFTTENSHDGSCHNPHDLARSAGGSSGGSGAAIASGMVNLTLGSDTNGSIRVPASFCGVWGLKPTFGRLSRRGSYPFVHSIDHLGPLASDVEGLAWSYDAMQGADALDPACHATNVQPVSNSLTYGIEGLRIGQLGGYFHDFATSPAREAVALAAKTLGGNAEVDWPDAALGRAAAFIVTASEGANLHLADLHARLDDFEPHSVDRLISGALQPATWYIQAQRFRQIYQKKINTLFQDWDILLAPATPVAAPELGAEFIYINGVRFPCRPSIGLLTQPISFMGCPVVVAPMWPLGTGGMPLGVQIIAPPWREDLALRAAWMLSQSGVAYATESNRL